LIENVARLREPAPIARRDVWPAFRPGAQAQVVCFLFSLLAAAIVRLHITRGTAAITVILATPTTATTRATTAMAGEVTIGLSGAIAVTAGTMAGGGGTGGAADTAGMAADGTRIIDSVLQFRQVSDKVANPFGLVRNRIPLRTSQPGQNDFNSDDVRAARMLSKTVRDGTTRVLRLPATPISPRC
jgi:hypothetical protein